jgi:hypothetical protein
MTPLFYCCVFARVHGVVAWQCADHIHYNINSIWGVEELVGARGSVVG